MNQPVWEMVVKLIIAALLGALVGLERETHGRPAGLRTHILVCIGSALFTLCSYNIAGKTFDPGRITAQIVTGIGFLGAGTIIHQGSVIRGLTTAASIWTVSAIGVAVAVGGYMIYIAAAASLLTIVTLNLVAKFERRILEASSDRVIIIKLKGNNNSLPQAINIIATYGARIQRVEIEETPDNKIKTARINLKAGGTFNDERVMAEIHQMQEVVGCQWE